MAIPSGRFGLMTPLLLGGGHRRSRFGAQRRRGMQGARPAERSWTTWTTRTPWAAGRTASHSGSTHHRLAGTNGAAIDRLAGDGRGAARGHPRPRGLLLLSLPREWTRLLLLQARHHVGTRRYDGARGRLSSQIRTRLRTQRCSRGWRRQWRSRFARSRWRSRRCGAGHRLRWHSDGRRRQRRRGRRRRQGLPRSR
jgi:hypothetical protein